MFIGSRRNRLHAIAYGGGRVQGMMTYYDNRLGRNRYKRRYIWASWAFLAGMALGAVVSHLI